MTLGRTAKCGARKTWRTTCSLYQLQQPSTRCLMLLNATLLRLLLALFSLAWSLLRFGDCETFEQLSAALHCADVSSMLQRRRQGPISVRQQWVAAPSAYRPGDIGPKSGVDKPLRPLNDRFGGGAPLSGRRPMAAGL